MPAFGSATVSRRAPGLQSVRQSGELSQAVGDQMKCARREQEGAVRHRTRCKLKEEASTLPKIRRMVTASCVRKVFGNARAKVEGGCVCSGLSFSWASLESAAQPARAEVTMTRNSAPPSDALSLSSSRSAQRAVPWLRAAMSSTSRPMASTRCEPATFLRRAGRLHAHQLAATPLRRCRMPIRRDFNSDSSFPSRSLPSPFSSPGRK